jgi:hypothetical protein
MVATISAGLIIVSGVNGFGGLRERAGESEAAQSEAVGVRLYGNLASNPRGFLNHRWLMSSTAAATAAL